MLPGSRLTGAVTALAALALAGCMTALAAPVSEARERNSSGPSASLPLARFHESTQALYRFTSGIREERLIAIRSHPEWEGQWNRITRPIGLTMPPPEVDFPREMLLMAAMGSQPSGGYQVVIERVVEQDELLAFIRFIRPGPRCGAIAMVTSPVDVVRIPASPKAVRWVVEREARDCP